MNSGSAMRNSKARSILYALAVCGMCLTAYLLSRTHSELKTIEKSHNRCIQQRDSLSAQLQVVYEHKNRLEKSLQEEKASYKNFRLDSQKSIVSLQSQMGTEKKLAQEKLDSINKEHEELQEQFDESDRKVNMMKDLVERLKQNLTQAEEARMQSQSEFNNQIQTIRQQKEEQISKLEEVIRELQKNERDLTHNNLSLALKIQEKTHKEGEKNKQVEPPHLSSKNYFFKKNIFPVHSINNNRVNNEYWLNVNPKPLLLRPYSQDLKINKKPWTSKYSSVPQWIRRNGKGMKNKRVFREERWK
ncbi:uncharacterized protein LOC143250987 isoform X2 [Tachypleus tridentatus]|uniref:uncharacterized protein LOC143250987 isoform X2 n=1 Tax=Tachypleus tridentatus TaxID=6853 RepID=UPI003FD3BC6D